MNRVTEPTEALERTLARLRRHGWCQHAYQDNQGRMCLLGAMGESFVNCPPAEQVIEDIAREQFPARMPAGADFVNFNDHPDTTFADVELVLEKAIAHG